MSINKSLNFAGYKEDRCINQDFLTLRLIENRQKKRYNLLESNS